MSNDEHHVPPLGFHALTRFYDRVLQATLKETHFKSMLTAQAQLAPGHRVLDLGCGTATLTMLLKQAQPGAVVIGLDPDEDALTIARRKVERSGLDLTLRKGRADRLGFETASFDRVVSSLVLHHLERPTKVRVLCEIRRILKPGGELHVVDWGRAQNLPMRVAFLAVQLLDGFGPTSDNVRGLLPSLMQDAGFANVEETHREATLFGTLALYRAVCADAR